MKKKKISILVSFLLIIMLTASLGMSTFVFAENPTQQEELISALDNGAYDEFTDINNPNGVYINRYISDNYSSQASIYGDNGINFDITGEDPIVNIIPKNLFKEVGKTFYVGKEYGFIVDAFRVIDSSYIHSIVMVFDIMYEDEMIVTFNHLKVTVKPLFQAEFAYIDNSEGAIQAAIRNYDTNKYYEDYHTEITDGIKVNLKNGIIGDVVIPVPTNNFKDPFQFEFIQCNKYFLNNATSLVSLYNEYHANPYDSEYVSAQDNGAFFTQTDFEYNGKYLVDGNVALNDVGPLEYM